MRRRFYSCSSDYSSRWAHQLNTFKLEALCNGSDDPQMQACCEVSVLNKTDDITMVPSSIQTSTTLPSLPCRCFHRLSRSPHCDWSLDVWNQRSVTLRTAVRAVIDIYASESERCGVRTLGEYTLCSPGGIQLFISSVSWKRRCRNSCLSRYRKSVVREV